MILLSAAESRELDRLSIEVHGIPSYALMTRAGEVVARAAKNRWPDALSRGVLVVAGKGNNGGDGFVTARALAAEKIPIKVMLLASVADLKGDAAQAARDYLAAGGRIVERADVDSLNTEHPGIIIDAIFGTGLNAPVRGGIRDVIERINAMEVPIVAVDIASGINADSGAVLDAAVRAACTVTFGFAKYGHVSYPGVDYCGELEVVDIGFSPAAAATVAAAGRLVELSEARTLIRPRHPNSHKGTYGHILIIAGGRGKAGAAILVARGALRSGAGLVTAAIPECVAMVVANGQAELMTEPIADRNGHFDSEVSLAQLRQLIEGKDAIVLGPGIGNSGDTQALLAWLIREVSRPELPIVIDADGLNALSALGAETLRTAQGPIVLTPHPGEMARLLSSNTGTVNGDRIGAARRLFELTGAAVVLKGARSVIVSPAGVISINASGNAGMATPGMGDVLSGIIGTLLGQKIASGDAAKLGVFVHGLAADRLASRIGPYGYLAGDLAMELPATFRVLAG
ncbi:MAG TPA: NAD(P)H-hydrate dehydratase [Candidatus Binataceae bacterium]|nr:NAD(P)H-hydrate dehydratase [Candidatus Binataceae bacterium]